MLLLTLACLGVLAGCGSVKRVKNVVGRAIPGRNSELSVKVDIAAEANLNSPIAVDVAFIKDKGLMKSALTMQAQDWFGKKDELRRRFRKSLQVGSWEWVPGQSVTPIVINVPRKLAGAMVFANYASPGSHSAPLPLGGKVSISMQQNDFTLESNK
jgi:type VI secretion system protein